MQHARRFIVGCANGWLRSPGRQSTPNSKLGELYMQHVTIRVTRWLVTCLQSSPIGTNFAGFCSNLKQFYWCKRRGLFSNLGARGLLSSLAAFLLGAHWLASSRSPDGGGESHHFTGNQNPSPCRLPAPAPAAPHNKTYFLSFKNQQEKYQTHEL